jgi:hypothetical protein
MNCKSKTQKTLWITVFFLGCFLLSVGGKNGTPLSLGNTAAARSVRRNVLYPRERGMLFNLGLGVNGCSDRLCHDVSPMIDLRLAAIFRFMRYYGVGLHMGFLFGYPDDTHRHYLSAFGEASEFDEFWLLVIAPEFRLFLPRGNWDLWAGILPGYARWISHGDFHPSGDGFDAYMNGFVMGWGVGADYFLHRMFALGAAAYFYHPFFDEVCAEVRSYEQCGDIDRWDRHDIGMWWSIGLRFTVFLGF